PLQKQGKHRQGNSRKTCAGLSWPEPRKNIEFENVCDSEKKPKAPGPGTDTSASSYDGVTEGNHRAGVVSPTGVTHYVNATKVSRRAIDRECLPTTGAPGDGFRRSQRSVDKKTIPAKSAQRFGVRNCLRSRVLDDLRVSRKSENALRIPHGGRSSSKAPMSSDGERAAAPN
ncbi:hypothetical protein AB4144_42920, partial [Rhizobiaceae sp. 2RAB30]